MLKAVTSDFFAVQDLNIQELCNEIRNEAKGYEWNICSAYNRAWITAL